MRWLLAIACLSMLAFASSEDHQCQYCEPNTYCFVDVLHQCPPHSSSPAGSDDVTDCVCHAGFYLDPDDSARCQECDANYYCPGGLEQLRKPCPANAESISGSTQADMCMCSAGFSHTGNTLPYDCEACAAGSIKPSAGNLPCTPCTEGEYSLSTLACSSCPPLTHSVAGSADLRACVTVPGAYAELGPGQPGLLCPPGTYQDEANQTSCKMCPDSTYQSAFGATQAAACVACPQHSSITPAAPGVSLANCTCNPGHVGPDGGPCLPCAAGSSKATSGSSPCQQCPADMFATAGSSTCEACPANSNSAAGSEALSNCLCAAGYEATVNPFSCVSCAPGSAKVSGNTACVQCAAGSFANNSAMEACETCPADTYSAIGSPQCQACAVNEFSASGSDSVTDCLCVTGYFRPAGFDDPNRTACTPCPLGTFRDSRHWQDWGSLACTSCPIGYSTQMTAATSGDECALCPAGFFILESGHLEGACVTCGANAESDAGTVGGCLCSAGFAPSSEACVECEYGFYKPLAGNHSCTACAPGKQGTTDRVQEATACVECAANTHWTAAGANCTACQPHSQSPPGSLNASDCSCNAGFASTLVEQGACYDDRAWQDSSGAHCYAYVSHGWCLSGGYGPGWQQTDGVFADWAVEGRDASQACCACGGGAIAQTSFTACLACEAGTYKASVSSTTACAPCDGKEYSSTYAASACELCPANSTGDFRNDADWDCKCDTGFTGDDGGPCVQCELGTYKTQRGTHICNDCGPSAFWPVGADPAVFACEACPTYSTRSSDLGSGVLGCVCDAGYRRTTDTSCAICPADYYCPEQHIQTRCPMHSFSAAGSSTLLDCQCVAGFHGGAGNCSACPANTFCEPNSALPAQCPANSTTLGQATRTNVSACVCLGGFYREQEASQGSQQVACRVCERDSFCFGDMQLACPANSSAPPGADSVLDCICEDGMQREVTEQETVCKVCAATEICRGGVVTQCESGATNVHFRCVCAAGSYCPGLHSNGSCSVLEGEPCRACPQDHWCADNALTACGANEVALANSSRHSQCRCSDGFYRDHLGACTECPLHHVCWNETRRAVADFDPGLRTLAKRTVFLTQAVCAAGLFRTAKTDRCKVCPADFYCPSEVTLTLPNVVRCPENEYTQTPGASSRAECSCMAGFKLSTTEEVARCLPCLPGERCQGGTVLEVECHLQNKAINADHSQCVCAIGFGFYNFLCQQCPPGFVKPVIGDTLCVECGIGEYAVNSTTCLPCPDHADARPGSAQCTCAPPYVLHQHTCVLCATNHFWIPGPGGAGACLACPASSSNQPSADMELGLTACRCAPGYNVVPSNVSGVIRCDACVAGKYEREGVCANCPVDAWAPAQSDSVLDCVCNAMPSANHSNATCHALRIDRSCAGICASTPPPCVACTPGHHKPAASTPGNTERCLACTEGLYQPASAALLCEACPLHEWHMLLHATARSQCLCVAGFTRPQEHNASLPKAPCAACAGGYYKDWLGDEICAPCDIGRYNPHLNATYCHFCSDASLELLLAANATRPVLNSRTTVFQASVSVLDCVCERGHEPRDVGGAALECRQCIPGSFKEHKDHEHCSYCGAPSTEHGHSLLHHFGAQGSGAANRSHCIACPAFSGQDEDLIGPGLLVMDNFTDCKCFPGHENRSAQSCAVCPQYMLQTAYSDDACVFCPAGHFFVDRHVPCQACYLADDGGPAHELLVLNRNNFMLPWGADGGDCVCRLGYERATDACRACATGKFRGSNLTRFCAECPVDTFQNTTANLQCRLCPPNSSTLNEVGKTVIEHCVCGPGFQPLAQGLCLPCPAGTYRQSRLANESEQACVQCPADHYCPVGSVVPQPCPTGELALPGSAEIDHCLCPPGRGRAAGPAHAPDELSNPCRPCAHGFFAAERSNSECTACPALKNTSALAATSLSNCTCVPGYGVLPQHNLADPCSPCADGFFAVGGRNAPCTHCGWGAVTEPPSAASSASHCQCNALLGLYDSQA